MQGWVQQKRPGSGLNLLPTAQNSRLTAFTVERRTKHAFSDQKPRSPREGRRCEAAQRRAERYMIPPDHRLEVDEELWGLLDICSNEELEEIYKILYGRPVP